MTAQRYAGGDASNWKFWRAILNRPPVALRLLGLLEFQQGHFDAAAAKFRQLLQHGQVSR